MEYCKVCNKNSISVKGLLMHARKSHDMSSIEYYLVSNKPGTCKTCGKNTKFISYNAGYRQYCSSKCAAISETTKDKRTTTNIDKYGCANISQVDTIKQVKLEKYSANIDKIKEKVKQTNQIRYGCDWITQSQSFKDKSTKTKLLKYGQTNFVNSVQYKEKIKLAKAIDICYMLDNGFIELTKINSEYGTGWHQQHRDKIIVYKNKGYVHKDYLDEIKTYCNKSKSLFQKDIIDFVNESNLIINSRSIIAPYELDIYIPNHNLAIECNGSYWHSKVPNTYHLMKTKLCEEKGIRLIHISDWLWNNKSDICKSILNAALNKSTVINAYDCVIKEIDNVDNFLEDFHINGKCFYDNCIGLFYNNDLIQIIALSNNEIVRFCTKNNIAVKNGLSVLVNYANKELSISIDRSIEDRSLYENNQFILIKEVDPSYSYYKNCVKIDKANNVVDKKEQQMTNNGYHKVYDCGQLIYKRGRV